MRNWAGLLRQQVLEQHCRVRRFIAVHSCRDPFSQERQQQAIELAPAGQRKVVLATNIGETSLTIEGIQVVVDSGLVREAVFDSATSVTRLTTRRISRASARQRAGRSLQSSLGAEH